MTIIDYTKNGDLNQPTKAFKAQCPECGHDEFNLGALVGKGQHSLGEIHIVKCTLCDYSVPIWNKYDA